MLHMMVDIETYGVKPGAEIRSIGAVVFDPYGDPINTDFMFYHNLIEGNGFREPATVQYWEEQSPEAQAAFSLLTERVHLVTALNKLTDFYNGYRCERLWCHGAGFDAPHLENAYERAWLKAPWKFRDVRDTRTVYELADESPTPVLGYNTKHHALHDAFNQAAAVQRSYNKVFSK